MINSLLKNLNKCNKTNFIKSFKRNFDLTMQQKMEKLKHISLYKRKMPNVGINFTSRVSQEMLKESLEQGSAASFFHIIDQLHTQTDPMYCGPATMTCIFNALGIDPKAKWKGIWRWYLEEVIKCLDLQKIKNHGMTLEEFAIISKCNGVFTEVFRPDENEKETENKMMKYLGNRLEKFKEKNSSIKNTNKLLNQQIPDENINFIDHNYENKYEIISHSHYNTECKKSFHIKINECNLDLFRTAIYATTRRDNFFLITNTSRKALKQTGEGHFSPVAAYHKKSDYILILDSARFKYNSMWFNIESVYNAFKLLDKATNLQRGFLLSSRYYYLCPRICKTSIDINSSHFFNDALDNTNIEFNMLNLKTASIAYNSNNSEENFVNIFANFIQSFVKNINFFNDIQAKSQILYYHHDLENRSSFMLNEEFLNDYIKYEHDNVNITKEIILKDIKNISDYLIQIYFSHLESSYEFKVFFVFLYYLDKENFVDIFTLLILAYLDFPNIKLGNKMMADNFSSESLSQSLICVKNNPIIQKEIKIIKECLNLRTPLKFLCKN